MINIFIYIFLYVGGMFRVLGPSFYVVMLTIMMMMVTTMMTMTMMMSMSMTITPNKEDRHRSTQPYENINHRWRRPPSHSRQPWPAQQIPPYPMAIISWIFRKTNIPTVRKRGRSRTFLEPSPRFQWDRTGENKWVEV